MLATRGSVAVALVLMMLPLAGCIGDDAPEPQVKTGSGEEIATGRPTESFSFKGAGLAPTGTIEKEMKERPRDGPDGPVQDQVFGERPPHWRLNVTVSNLIDLGAGGDGEDLGEAFYHLWKGVPAENGEGITWEPAGTPPKPAVGGELNLGTAWQSDYGRFTAVRLTVETRDDNGMEIPILEYTEMPEDEAGTWDLVDLKTFGEAFGDARVSAGAKETDVNITISAFGLPVAATSGEFDVFLRNRNGPSYLGTLGADATSSGLTLAIKLDEKELAGNWQIFVSLEKPGEDKKAAATGLMVLKSSF